MSEVKFCIVFVGLMDSAKVHLERFGWMDGWMDGWMNGVLGHFYALSRLNWAEERFGRKIQFMKANNTSVILSTRFSCKSVSFQFYHPQIIFAVLQETFSV